MTTVPSPTGVREYTISVDMADHRLKMCSKPAELIQGAATDIQEQLIKLGLQPKAQSPILFFAAVDTSRTEDDWTLIEELKQLIEEKTLPIRIGIQTVGGERTEPYHPDILKVMKECPGFENLDIDGKILVLRNKGLIS